MSEYVIEVGAEIPCGHQSGRVAVATSKGVVRVRLGGRPAVLVGDTAVVSCSANSPCVSAVWTTGAGRVKSMGLPLVTRTSQSAVSPSGVPLKGRSALTQTRVKAT